MDLRRLMKIFAIVTAFGAYTMLLLGVLVTQTNSGQGCGHSWPLCHGQLLPDSMTINSFYEYSHRIISGLDGFFILILTAWSWFTYRKDFQVKLFSALSLFFVILQGALGALTVVFEGTFMKDGLLSLHFGFSLISFASVALLAVRLFRVDKTGEEKRIDFAPVSKSLQYSAWGLAAYSYIVVYSGAFVEHSQALLGCGQQFPGCSTYVPGLSSPAGIQLLHRYAAGIIWLFVLAFLIVVLRNYRDRKNLVRGSWWAFILVTLQALSGIANVLTGGILMIALLHPTIIAFFFTVLCYLCTIVGLPGKQTERLQTGSYQAAP